MLDRFRSRLKVAYLTGGHFFAAQRFVILVEHFNFKYTDFDSYYNYKWETTTLRSIWNLLK